MAFDPSLQVDLIGFEQNHRYAHCCGAFSQVDAQVKILIAENDLYLAEVGRPAALRVALGPRVAPDYDRS